jgi:hypothetical protein
MARLFEFSDQSWLPSCLRRILTELLQFQAARYQIYRPAIPKLNDLLDRSGCREILDLCSGSGGPLLHLHPWLEAEHFTLSDRYPMAERPSVASEAGRVEWLPRPLDARDVPPALKGCRTLFTSFHHFDEANARRILQGAVEARAPIAVFEFTERTFARMWRLVCAPLVVWYDVWHMRPRKWSRLFWTYVLPVVPLLYTWDAIVSHLRTYSPRQMRDLTAGLTGHEWEAGAIPWIGNEFRILYLVGLPAS